MTPWQKVIDALEPETKAYFSNEYREYFNAADIERAVSHSRAVSAAKANKYADLIYSQQVELLETLTALRVDIQSVQTFGLRIAT